MKLTSASLFRVMKPGQVYHAREIAVHFDSSTAEVNDMLCTLVEDGMIRMNSHVGRLLCFERLTSDNHPDPLRGASEKTVAPESTTSVATRPITRTLSGALQHYDASLESVRRLAMLTRQSR